MIETFLMTRGLAATTTAAYRRILRRLEADHPDLLGLDAVGLSNWLDGTGWGSAMRWLALCCVKSYLRWRFGEDHPALVLRMKRLRSGPQRALKLAQVQALLASFDTSSPKGRRDLAMCCLMLDSGLRSAEVCRLDAMYVDLVERRLEVVVKGGEWKVGVFSEYTSACIATWMGDRIAVVQGNERALFVGIGGATPGRRMSTGGLRAIMRTWARAAGLAALSPHDLRRSFATLAIRLGAPSRVVQTAGRWSNLMMVERYTSSIEAEDMRRWFPVSGAMGDSES
jgi:integrase/recombinase XerD